MTVVGILLVAILIRVAEISGMPVFDGVPGLISWLVIFGWLAACDIFLVTTLSKLGKGSR